MNKQDKTLKVGLLSREVPKIWIKVTVDHPVLIKIRVVINPAQTDKILINDKKKEKLTILKFLQINNILAVEWRKTLSK